MVFHTASPHADAPAAVLERVNVQGTANVIEACRAARLDGAEGDGGSNGKMQGARLRALVYTSSASVVFDARRKHPAGLVNADERWPVVMGKAQSEFYTDTKVSIRIFLLLLGARPALPLVIVVSTTCAIEYNFEQNQYRKYRTSKIQHLLT